MAAVSAERHRGVSHSGHSASGRDRVMLGSRSAILRVMRGTSVYGQVRFYDEPTAWGLILGADGELYAVRGVRLPGPPLEVGEQVLFEPQAAPGGPRAAAVRRLKSAGAGK